MELIVCGPEDLDVLTSLYAQAVKYLESHVNYPKWHSDYPCRDSIRSCIQAGTQFICTENGCPVGAVVLNEEPGGRYEAVSWASSLRQGEYLVLHTLAVSPVCYGQGVGSKMVALCIQYARKMDTRLSVWMWYPAMFPPSACMRKWGLLMPVRQICSGVSRISRCSICMS